MYKYAVYFNHSNISHTGSADCDCRGPAQAEKLDRKLRLQKQRRISVKIFPLCSAEQTTQQLLLLLQFLEVMPFKVKLTFPFSPL